MSAFIELRDARFSYDTGHQALHGVSLDIELGESVALIGQNGAGKTTLAKLMNGLYRPTSGTVSVGGINTSQSSTAMIARRVGYVFQNPDDQIFHNDVFSEIEFGPKMIGKRGRELKSRIAYSTDLCGIRDILDENPYNLPYSMRKFVAIASTVAVDCRAYILDEPTAGQDAAALTRMARIVDALREEGKAVITVTHDMQFVVDNFERTIVMVAGQTIADARTREVLSSDDVLKRAQLRAPFVGELARELGLTGVLSIDDFLEFLCPSSPETPGDHRES